MTPEILNILDKQKLQNLKYDLDILQDAITETLDCWHVPQAGILKLMASKINSMRTEMDEVIKKMQ